MSEITLTELKYPDKFSAFMDQLLNKKFNSTPIRPPNDRGRDSYVRQINGDITIYQYKFFKTGKEFNKKDVKDSLETAIKNYDAKLKEWFLCIPREITSVEEDFLDELSKEKEIKILILGEAAIKNMIADTNFPIEDYLDSQLHKKSQKDIKKIKDMLTQASESSKEIKFEVMEKVVKHLISAEDSKSIKSDNLLVAIKDKINRNKLSSSFEDLLKLQMIKFPQVDKYLRSGAISQNEIVRLLTSLKMVYLKFKDKFETGDEIFSAMVNEVCPNGCTDQEYQAYIAIICYFFQSCEVFEKC